MNRRIIRVTLLVALASTVAASAQGRRELQFPDLPGLRTLKCDFHVHTVFSDGLVWPTVRIDEAWREGLDAIAMTDHIEYQPHKADVPTNFNRSFEIAAARARERNILLIRGAEITRDTPPGHFNAVFLKDIPPLKTDDLFDVFRHAAEQGAFVFWNHPGWQGKERGKWAEVQDRAYDAKILRGIEVCNGDEYYEEALQWALEKNLTLLGNSDIHEPSSDRPWTAQEHRTLTLVFARERTLEAIQEALLERRTAVWAGNILYGREEHLAAFFKASAEPRPIHHQTKDDVFFELLNRSELDLELINPQGSPGKPRIVPARSTALLRLPKGRLDEAKQVSFRVQNLITAPARPLEVKLAVP